MLAIPLSQLHSLQLHWKKKIGGKLGIRYISQPSLLPLVLRLRLQYLQFFPWIKIPDLRFILVAIMFCTGTFVTVISVVRLQSLVEFGETDNPTWNNLKVSLWSTIEINVGIITCCMPTIRLMMLRLFPKMSSTYRSTQAYYAKNGFSQQSKGKRSRSRTNELSSQEQPSANSAQRPAGGIEYSRGYTVQFHDAEAGSQVQLRDLDSKGFAAKTSISECSA